MGAAHASVAAQLCMQHYGKEIYINHGYHGRQSQFLPKEDVALVIWGNKVTGNILTLVWFHASKEVAGNIWQHAKRISGQTNVSTQWTGNTWILHSRTRQTCTSYGGPSNIQVLRYKGSSRLLLRQAVSRQTVP